MNSNFTTLLSGLDDELKDIARKSNTLTDYKRMLRNYQEAVNILVEKFFATHLADDELDIFNTTGVRVGLPERPIKRPRYAERNQ